MKKVLKTVLVAALAVAVAAPAMAELKLNGYYRVQGNATNIDQGAVPVGPAIVSKDADTRTFIDQRLRMMLTNQLNDNVKFVYFAEVDTPWGESSKGTIGGGGKLGADGVNIETKHAYLDLKFASLSTRLGIQGIGSSFEGLVFNDDMAGATASAKLGGIDATLGYAKWDEGARHEWDETDLYLLKLSTKLSDQGKVGFDVYFNDNNTTNGEVDDFYYGVYGDYRFGSLGFDGFFLLRDYSYDGNPKVSADDVDGSAYAASLRLLAKLEKGDLKVRALYFSKDDDAEDRNFFDASKGNYEFAGDNLSIFLTDAYYNNGAQGAIALENSAYKGYGLMGLTVSGSYQLPSDYYARYGVGYFAALDDTINDAAAKSVKGKSLGTEVALMVGKKVLGNVDVSLRGSYAFLGSFFDSMNPAVGDPDNLWTTTMMVNVGY